VNLREYRRTVVFCQHSARFEPRSLILVWLGSVRRRRAQGVDRLVLTRAVSVDEASGPDGVGYSPQALDRAPRDVAAGQRLAQ